MSRAAVGYLTEWDKCPNVECAHCGKPGVLVRDIIPYGHGADKRFVEKSVTVNLHEWCWSAWMKGKYDAGP